MAGFKIIENFLCVML